MHRIFASSVLAILMMLQAVPLSAGTADEPFYQVNPCSIDRDRC